MKNLYAILLLCVWWIQSPCQDPISIDIVEIIQCKEEPVLSLFADTVSYIKLATQENCLIGRISQVAQIDDMIVISDRTSNRIFVFNDKGEFKNNIGFVGKGPGEYINLLYGFVIDRKLKQVLINCASRHSILRFALDGTLIEEIKLDRAFTNIGFINDNIVAYTSSSLTPLSNNYLIEVIDRKGTNKGVFHKYKVKRNALEHMATVYNFGQNLRYWEKPFDAVFEFDGKTYRKHFEIEFGKFKMPEEFFYDIKTLNREFKKYLILQSLTEFANFIYLTVFINNPPGVKKYFYYPGSGVTYCSSFKKESRSWGIENDITGGPPFSFEFKVSENAVCCAYEVADLLEYKRLGINPPKKIKSPEGNNHLLNIIESSSINDNPILQIVKLK